MKALTNLKEEQNMETLLWRQMDAYEDSVLLNFINCKSALTTTLHYCSLIWENTA